MHTIDNKALVQRIHAELDRGNGQAFIDSLADDASWTLEGSTPWSRTYQGKQAIREELIKPLFGQFAGPYVSKTECIIAEGDRVVVLFSGDVPTKAGKRYNNRYCYVYRLEGGQVKTLTEYFDTALVERALDAPTAHAG
ncbi:nuclear transport factor 2 family protein [Variovorax boronicumulans]|uniref:nuclear transport factor 2 family protein n=1 Tax=Variovorax boronicumulans TaxID=436515 RepID=UPI0012E66DC2|nr:nuclear transport factor 2 family protein [Variovorax boronicumulans]GER09776.1 ketosteroid isomerase [Variovorax boronicumulans]GER15286.1 ketosteroid isomerase [Variovorax boronicumulans]